MRTSWSSARRWPTSWPGTACPSTCAFRVRGIPARRGIRSIFSGTSVAQFIQQLIVGIPGLLAALVLHEYAHAQVSTWLGDPTPGLHGRLSLNPLVHIDWIGMLMLWVFHFGWARPVQIDPRYYRNQRLGLVLVAVAGPAMNVVVAWACLVLGSHVAWPATSWGQAIAAILSWAVLYNVFFAVFNILPIPPLDGSRILSAVSVEGGRLMAAIEPWGWILLIVLVFTSLIARIIDPMEAGLVRVLAILAGASPLG